MDLKLTTPTKAYKVIRGGNNFVIVHQIYLFQDNFENFIVFEKNKLRKKLYSKDDVKKILSESEGFFTYDEEQIMVLKLICCRYRFVAHFVLFYSANSSEGKIFKKDEILGDDINSEMYRCTPWVLNSNYDSYTQS